jgi:hypothetical protein
METFVSGAIVVEGALLSFLLALWMTWLGLLGPLRLIPVTISPATGRPLTSRSVRPIRFVENRQEANRQRDGA